MKRDSWLPGWARVVGSGLMGVALVGSLWAADAPRKPLWLSGRNDSAVRHDGESFDKPATESATLRLHYSNAPWQGVLEKFASEAGCTLTLHDAPPGTFSRLDTRKYTRTDAVRILNRELEPLGFRILVKDDHLTVLAMQQARSTYRRPVSPEAAPQVDAANVTPAGTSRDRRSQLQQRFETITRERRPAGSQIVQAGAVEEDGAAVTTSDHEETVGDAEAFVGEMTESVYQPQHRPAVDLAQTIYRSFKSRAQLVDAGAHGLPAFRVYRQTPTTAADNVFAADRSAGNTWFTMEIDTAGNRLLLAAPRDTAAGLTNLIGRLDVPTTAAAPDTKVMEGTKATLHVARQLQPELGRLQEAKTRQAPRQKDAAGMELAWQANDALPAQAEEPAPTGQPPAQVEQQIPSALSGLRGEVTLEALDDLNLLILRGNEEDLRQVQEVIDMIEQLAVGTRPELHILFLNNVNSEALAELLNDVYQRLGNLRNVGAEQGSQTVNVVPIATPNAILILAPTNTMESVIGLAEELDRPGDPRSEVEIFPLKSAVATQVVEVLNDFYEERAGLGARIQATADVRTNTVIVHARPAELAEVKLIVRRMDRGHSNSTNQIQVVQLQQAAADELAEFLTTTIQGILNPPTQQAGAGGFGGANQGAQELRDTKAVVLEFLRRDGNAQQLIRSGLLSDVRVTGDLRTNSLTVIAPEQTMKLMLELISVLDQPSAAIADIKVFQLENADATAAVELLNELFATDDEDQLGIAINGASDASSSLIPLKFSVDPRTNTVVAVGGLEALTVVEAILARLDASDLRERETTVLKLRNSRADDVALAINSFVQAQLDLVQIDPDRISTNEIIDQTYIVVSEPATNTLLISASPRYFEQIMRLARELDVVPPQVMISALIVEVDLLDTDEWGVELGFQDPILFGRSAITDAVTNTLAPGFLFNNQPLGNSIPFRGNTSTVGGQGLSNFSLGRTNGDLGFGGLVLSASSDSVSVLLRALKARRNIRVLSAPKVHALDNQEAVIQDGQLVPIVNGVIVNGLTTTPQIIQQETGLILTVTPRITPEGEVVMGVSAQKSALSGATVPIFFDTNSGNTINSPIIDQTIATTTVMVNDGQTVVLGGIIVESDTVNERKVPYLGDLPYIGHAFRFDSNVHQRGELLIFLTPHIVHNDADFELIKQVEAERINFFEHEAEQVHGPLFSVPAPQPEVLYGDEGYEVISPGVGSFPTGQPDPPAGPSTRWELDPALPGDGQPPIPAPAAGDDELQFIP